MLLLIDHDKEYQMFCIMSKSSTIFEIFLDKNFGTNES
jgi:hypothetical protein